MEATPVRIEELLAHASWVRALAARLVRDAATADDVAQEVWASALRRPPRERTNLRGWLARAVQRAAHSLQRGEQRRRDRERAVPPACGSSDPAQLVERAQLHRELVEHVLALEEPQRSLVLAHWFEGSSVTEAGRRLGLTARVAQLRLDAAHEELRKRLDRKWGGRGTWSAAFAQWTRPEGVATAASGALAIGGIAVATKWIVSGAAAAVLAGLAVMNWPRDASDEALASITGQDEPRGSTVVAPPEQAAASAIEPAPSAARAPASGQDPAPVIAPEPRWLVRGRVKAASHLDLSRTQVRALFLGSLNILDSTSGVAGPDGSFELDLTAIVAVWTRQAARVGEGPVTPAELLVTAEHPLCLRSETRSAFDSARPDPAAAPATWHVFTCDPTLTVGAVVTGSVVLPSSRDPSSGGGSALVAVRVGLYPVRDGAIRGEPGATGERGVDFAACDSDGRWILRSNAAGEFTVVVLAKGLPVETRRAELALGVATDVGAIPLAPGASIRGSVQRSGQPVGAGACVRAQLRAARSMSYASRIAWEARLGSDETTHTLIAVGSRLARGEVATQTDDRGRFELEGLELEEYELTVITGGTRPRMGLGFLHEVESTVRAPASGVVLGALPPLLHLSFSIDGRPPTAGELDDEVLLSLAPAGDEGPNARVRLACCLEQYGAIGVKPGVEYEFRLQPGKFDALEVRVPPLATSEERAVRLDLETSKARGLVAVRLLTEPGETISKARFALVNGPGEEGATPSWVTLEAGPDGKFVLRFLPAGAQRVHVLPYDTWWGTGTPYFGTEFAVDVLPDATAEREVRLEVGSRLRLSAKDERGGYVRAEVELRDARAERVAAEFYCKVAGGLYGCGWYLCEQGVNDHPPLPAGRYELTLTADGFSPQTVMLELLKGETNTQEITLRRN